MSEVAIAALLIIAVSHRGGACLGAESKSHDGKGSVLGRI
jgi:hypothetical protein